MLTRLLALADAVRPKDGTVRPAEPDNGAVPRMLGSGTGDVGRLEGDKRKLSSLSSEFGLCPRPVSVLVMGPAGEVRVGGRLDGESRKFSSWSDSGDSTSSRLMLLADSVMEVGLEVQVGDNKRLSTHA